MVTRAHGPGRGDSPRHTGPHGAAPGAQRAARARGRQTRGWPWPSREAVSEEFRWPAGDRTRCSGMSRDHAWFPRRGRRLGPGPVPGSGVGGCRRGLWLDAPRSFPVTHTLVLHPTEHSSPRGAPERWAGLHTAEGHLGPRPASPRVTRRPYHPERSQCSRPQQRERPAPLAGLTLRHEALAPGLSGCDPSWTTSRWARVAVLPCEHGVCVHLHQDAQPPRRGVAPRPPPALVDRPPAEAACRGPKAASAPSQPLAGRTSPSVTS